MMLFRTHIKRGNKQLNVSYQNELINETTFYKYLGILLDQSLSLSESFAQKSQYSITSITSGDETKGLCEPQSCQKNLRINDRSDIGIRQLHLSTSLPPS